MESDLNISAVMCVKTEDELTWRCCFVCEPHLIQKDRCVHNKSICDLVLLLLGKVCARTSQEALTSSRLALTSHSGAKTMSEAFKLKHLLKCLL